MRGTLDGVCRLQRHAAHLRDQGDVHPGLPGVRHLLEQGLRAHGLIPVQGNEGPGVLLEVQEFLPDDAAQAGGVICAREDLLDPQEGENEVVHLVHGRLGLLRLHLLHRPGHALDVGRHGVVELMLKGVGLLAQVPEDAAQLLLDLAKGLRLGAVDLAAQKAGRLEELAGGGGVGAHCLQDLVHLDRVGERDPRGGEVVAQVHVEGSPARLGDPRGLLLPVPEALKLNC
mmetsp:Transcript_70347/g.186983  ORF Transcript_70347/g.186983 Transcript_70347/m.186983 type:complete len:229 (+) Transcript_70347:208-894(+)